MKRISIYFILVFLVTLSSCTTTRTSDGYVVRKHFAKFFVHDLPAHWHKKHFSQADIYFEHQSKDASIYVNAECRRVSDSPLEALTSQMLGGMGKFEFLGQERRVLGDREALISEVKINLDGIDRFLKIMVLRKNRCIFDAVLSARELSPDLVEDFNRLIASLEATAEQ